MNKHDFINNKALSANEIKFIRGIVFLSLRFFLVAGFLILSLSVVRNSNLLVCVAAASLIMGFVVREIGDRFKEISITDYSALLSHKTNHQVKSYLDAVSKTGRAFIVKGEFKVMIDYCQNNYRHKEAVEKLFGPEDFDKKQ